MLGTLRLFLALAVALSHLGYAVRGLNPGVIAVVGFYLISGYVMSALLARHYAHPGAAPAFYADRLLRLAPQYLGYAGLTLAWYLLIRPHPENASLAWFLHAAAQPLDYLNNLLIIPLNYYMWTGSDRFTLIPPAWSLGAELQFYLIAPLLLLFPRRLVIVLLLALGVLVLALAGQVNSDWWGYRLHPGVLVYFGLGALLNRLHQRGQPALAHGLVGFTLLAACAAAFLAQRHGSLAQPYNQEVLLGLLLIYPLLHVLARRPRQAWDEFAGDLSYGVFLNHFLIYWAVFPQGVRPGQLPLFIGLSVLCAALSQRWLERPVLTWRQRLRRRSVES